MLKFESGIVTMVKGIFAIYLKRNLKWGHKQLSQNNWGEEMERIGG